jgi:hypothetical protein
MTLTVMLVSFAVLFGGPPAEVNAAAQTTAQSSQTAPASSSGSATAKPATDQNTAAQQTTPGATAPCASSPDTKAAPVPCNPPKHRKHRILKPTADPSGGPSKTVVRNGGTTEPGVQLGPGVTQQQASQQLQMTNQLLLTTDANLKAVAGRQLSAEQQETVKQIQSYVEQSKAAAGDGDVQRAYTLATKANLLSADLVGH